MIDKETKCVFYHQIKEKYNLDDTKDTIAFLKVISITEGFNCIGNLNEE